LNTGLMITSLLSWINLTLVKAHIGFELIEKSLFSLISLENISQLSAYGVLGVLAVKSDIRTFAGLSLSSGLLKNNFDDRKVGYNGALDTRLVVGPNWHCVH
jgi:hypothetical protein